MKKKDTMFALVEQYIKSEMKPDEFAAQHGFCTRTLDKWRRRYQKEQIAAQADFIEITPPPSEPTSELKPKIEIELPEGIRIKIY